MHLYGLFFSGNLSFLLSILRKFVIISLLYDLIFVFIYLLLKIGSLSNFLLTKSLIFSHIAVYLSKNSLLVVKKDIFLLPFSKIFK